MTVFSTLTTLILSRRPWNKIPRDHTAHSRILSHNTSCHPAYSSLFIFLIPCPHRSGISQFLSFASTSTASKVHTSHAHQFIVIDNHTSIAPSHRQERGNRGRFGGGDQKCVLRVEGYTLQSSAHSRVKKSDIDIHNQVRRELELEDFDWVVCELFLQRSTLACTLQIYTFTTCVYDVQTELNTSTRCMYHTLLAPARRVYSLV